MLLSKIFNNPGIPYVCTSGRNLETYNIEDITRDTREVKKGSLFIAVIGEKIDGHDLIEEAISKGATVIVYSKPIDKFIDDVCYIRVKDTREAMPIISMMFFDIKPSDINVLGVTGTNGKTTSAFMMKHILEHLGEKVGLIGTIANYIGDKKIEAERTTPESIELFRLIKDMKLAGCRHCVMEVSSHASALGRTTGLLFKRGIFTNLTQDHLDFHKTFEEYYKAKFKFVDSAKISVVNTDDSYGQRMVLDSSKPLRDTTTYGINSGMFRAKDIKLSPEGSKFNLYIGDKFECECTLNIPGLYNIYNALGVIAALAGYRYSLVDGLVTARECVIALSKMKAVNGRSERVYHDKLKTTVLVDYAHTPDAVDNLLKTMKQVTSGKIISVLGTGGDRDKTKRPLMAEASCKYSDLTIFTDDNPRTEDPDKIIEDILKGASGNYVVIRNRKDAIENALKIAKENDIVLIMGKGHEDYQIIGTQKLHFSDKETVIDYLNRN